MYIDVCRNNGKKYLRLVNSIRIKNKEGFTTPHKQVILHDCAHRYEDYTNQDC